MLSRFNDRSGGARKIEHRGATLHSSPIANDRTQGEPNRRRAKENSGRDLWIAHIAVTLGIDGSYRKNPGRHGQEAIDHDRNDRIRIAGRRMSDLTVTHSRNREH